MKKHPEMENGDAASSAYTRSDGAGRQPGSTSQIQEVRVGDYVLELMCWRLFSRRMDES